MVARKGQYQGVGFENTTLEIESCRQARSVYRPQLEYFPGSDEPLQAQRYDQLGVCI